MNVSIPTLLSGHNNLIDLQVVLAVEVLYVAGTAMVKTSVLCLYGRLFGVKGWFTILLLWIGIFVWAYSIAGILVVIFQCHPINAAWDLAIRGNCINLPLAAIGVGGINCAVDIITLCLPIPLVWQLQMKRKWKIQLIGIFLLGGL